MLLSKTVKVKWANATKKYYESKGYIFTKYGNELEIKVEDLSDSSAVYVIVQCDECGEILNNVRWCDYKRYVHEDNTYYCKKCGINLFGSKKASKTKLLNGKSFYEWCYENLSKKQADEIMDRWDYELNDCSPKDITFANNNKFWFKCPKNIHPSELKTISSFISNKCEGSIECKKCNSISCTYPQLIKYFINKEDTEKYPSGSHKKVPMECPDCGYIKTVMIKDLVVYGFGCNRCGDGISYPEKFMFSVLEQLGIDFGTQLSKANFEWCKNYKYDFYITDLNAIIETHGEQHYEESFSRNGGKTLKEEQENDKIKKELVLQNGIKEENYIVIDCRKSNLEWIRDNENGILNSRLAELFDLSSIDWLKCHEYACSNLVKVVCELWNSGIESTKEITNRLKIDKSTTIKYLKQGTELGFCKYNAKKSNTIK